MQDIRTFVAVDVSEAVSKRASKLIGLLKQADANVRWVDSKNLHLTLKFLGDVPNIETPSVCRAVAEAAQNFAPFEIEIAGCGAFPDVQRPRTVWIGVDAGTDSMRALHAAIDHALHEIGYPQDARRYTPHLTIGRVRKGGRSSQQLGQLITKHESFAGGTVAIHDVVTYASFLDKRSGPTYDALSRDPLAGG